MNQFSKLDKIFIFLAFVCGALILFVPVHYLLFAFLFLVIIFFLLVNPVYCYYAAVFSIPLVSPNIYYVHLQDVLILTCLAGTFLISRNNQLPKISFKTVLNKWIIAILILFIIKGLTAFDFERGILYLGRFIEAVILFYLTVYFIRTKKVKILTIVKILILTSLFQAGLGIIQSLSGKFGVQEYCTNRGYFGYLGLGPTTVYSGRGTFWHFAPFGHYMATILLFFLPIYHHCFKNKTIGKILVLILFMGVVFSYSRGAMASFILCYVYYLFLITQDKKAFFKKIALLMMILVPYAVYLLTNHNYIATLSLRNPIWNIHFAYLKNNPLDLWFGTGFESRFYGYFRYVPGNIPIEKYLNFNAHNLLLNFVEELGILGAVIYFSFLIKIFVDTFKRINKGPKLQRTLNLSLNLCFLMMFLGGINDHVYHNSYMLIFLMLLIGIVYAKNKEMAFYST